MLGALQEAMREWGSGGRCYRRAGGGDGRRDRRGGADGALRRALWPPAGPDYRRELALPSGEVVSFGIPCVKNVAGYALERLVVARGARWRRSWS